MHRSGGTLGLCVAVLLACSNAVALTTAISQTRSVSASAQVTNGPASSQSFSASDFAPFDQTASAYSQQPNTTGCCYVASSIRQTSAIEDGHFSAVLTGNMSYNTIGGPATTQSIYDVVFALSAASNYKISNGLRTYGSYGSHVVTLWDENGQVIVQVYSSYYPPGSQPGDPGFPSISGSLGPGTYRFTAQWDRNTPSDFGPENQFDALADLRFTAIPEPTTASLFALGLGMLGARAQIRRLRPCQ